MQYQKSNDVLNTVNRGNPCESGLCTLCRADCKGKCETWLASLKGRKLLYPRDFGLVTAGSSHINPLGVSYDSLRIQGFAYGAKGLAPGLSQTADDCIFPNVSVESSFGRKIKTKVRVPMMTGALGSTFIAAKYWDAFASGAALVGIPVVVGENVVGIDKEAVLEKGRIVKAPELDRRIETYMRYYDGYGAILVQLNVEDTRNGVAEYVADKYGDKVIIELKWGQGAKDIGGEIQVTDLDYAIFLKERGYVVDPDPTQASVQAAFKAGALKSFARHSRLGNVDADEWDEVREGFHQSVEHLRGLGFSRITLKTGSYGMEELAMAIRLASECGLDLLTIDGSGGGTGMSPWNMMEHWGIPSLYLHAKAYEYAQILSEQGQTVVDMAFAGGIAREDQIFKALALGGRYTKLVCMGRALMIPGFLGANIEGALYPERRTQVAGNWDALPKTVTDEFGTTPEEIFAGYHDVKARIGAEEMKTLPLGAIAVWTLADKLTGGLQQLMAGARKFAVPSLGRSDIYAANRATAEETGISFMTDHNDDKAHFILRSK